MNKKHGFDSGKNAPGGGTHGNAKTKQAMGHRYRGEMQFPGAVCDGFPWFLFAGVLKSLNLQRGSSTRGLLAGGRRGLKP
ncbi:MAG: hypothetical protein CM15mP103_03140 [Gammaproteobacteria bacterium]|nr:MAG: hypothetical protein CM15mP103_03140 [Gammaproteobacteria bacterium]